jgi:hypothetical protein
MFVRAKKSGAYQYLQLVRSERVDGHVRRQVIATLGRLSHATRFVRWHLRAGRGDPRIAR